MPANRETLLCRYHYDPLDRLVTCTLSAQVSTQRFYQKSRLATEIQGLVQHSIFQHDDQLLAQQQRQGDTAKTTLLATDQQRSVLNALDTTQPHPLAYTPYGHRVPENGLFSLLGFNGERPDPVTGHYLLGNGYRAFNPVLMRFNSQDSWSPFGEGGLNAYAYCVGDPVNKGDSSGHVPVTSVWARIRKFFGRSNKGYRPLTEGGENASRPGKIKNGAGPSNAISNLPPDTNPASTLVSSTPTTKTTRHSKGPTHVLVSPPLRSNTIEAPTVKTFGPEIPDANLLNPPDDVKAFFIHRDIGSIKENIAWLRQQATSAPFNNYLDRIPQKKIEIERLKKKLKNLRQTEFDV
jgi:RHS repeat-associated protein